VLSRRLPGHRRDTIVVYHAIGSIPRAAPEWNGYVRPDRFAAQMQYLLERRDVVDLDTLLAPLPAPGPPRVAITFDDGYRSVLEHAVPVLRELGIPATFFIPTQWIGESNTWDPPGATTREIMTAEELAELAFGGFAVESHGHAHIDYSRAEPRAVEDDLRTSVERLTELLGRPPRYLAYPYGRSSPAAVAEATRLGLRGAFALDHPQELAGDFARSRVPVVPADTRPLFALKTGGTYIGFRQSAPVRAAYDSMRPFVRNRWLWP
jgi:peptidoglycan/xylan/chitin deacetylase (PgdA/CDA1 family)